MSGRRVLRSTLAPLVVALLAACGAGAAESPAASSSPTGTPTRAAPSTTGELTAEEACLNSHGLAVGPAKRVGSAVRLSFGDGASDRKRVRYTVFRRPADKSRPWAAVVVITSSPSLTMTYLDTGAPRVELLYGVTVDARCGGTTPPPCDGGPCFFVAAPAVPD